VFVCVRVFANVMMMSVWCERSNKWIRAGLCLHTRTHL